MTQVSNIFAGLRDVASEEVVEVLAEGKGARIERIVSRGQASPEGFWYQQQRHEWVMVMRGAARLRFEGEEPIEMVAGSYVNIPAGRRHRVEWTDPDEVTVWLAVHY